MIENTPLQISSTIQNIPEALSIYINQIVYSQKRKGRDIVTLSLGEAFFDIPLFDFKKIDYVKGYHYSDSQGIPELREVIANFYEKQYGAKVNPQDEILITAGSKPAIHFSMQAILNPGDEVLIHEPGWLSYQEQAKITGAIPKFIPYQAKIDEFHCYFTPKTRILVLNNPNNPAGKIYGREELMSIYEQCRPKGIYVLIDEAYSDFVQDGEFHTMAKLVPDKEGIIVVNSLSKNLGMSGWRVGYVIAQPNIIRQILKINQHVLTCASTILLQYIACYFNDIIGITLPQVQKVVEKRRRIATLMDELGMKRMSGSSTFYFLVDIEKFPSTSIDFALHCLLNHQIAVVPGSAYGASCSRFIRVGIGAESEERIHDALLVIRDVINCKEFDAKPMHRKLIEEGFHAFEEKH